MNRKIIRSNRMMLKISEKEEKILLSVLIPTLLTRKKLFDKITDKLIKQINDNNLHGVVEIISHCDNKTVNLVTKRNNMTRSCAGKFIAHLDDDDDIGDTYLIDIVNTIKSNPEIDVITFKQFCDNKKDNFYVVSDLNYNISMEDRRGDTYFRYPWVWCVWNREKILKILINMGNTVGMKNWGEDSYLLKKIKESGSFNTQIYIDKVLHYYQFDPGVTECNIKE
jgi:hypothetical protein